MCSHIPFLILMPIEFAYTYLNLIHVQYFVSGQTCVLVLTYTLVFAIDVLQVKAIMTLADVASESVDALSEAGANGTACGALVHV